MSGPESGNIQIVRKLRRTRRHRRNRILRRGLLLAVLGGFAACAGIVVLRYLGPSIFASNRSDLEGMARSRGQAALLDRILAETRPQGPVYPYSLVPGGISDAKELKWIAEHDPVVAAHYAGFEYDNARVVQAALDRFVFVSYRIGNRVYWMRRRIALHKGEKLITDGHMTVRGRCGNRVEEKPQQEAANPEPPPEVFDHPVSGGGTATQAPPVPFESALLARPAEPALNPFGPLIPSAPFGGGGNLISLSPPPFPVRVCSVPTKKGEGAIDDLELAGGKKKLGPCGSGQGPSVVPEPATWVMLMSGIVLMYGILRPRTVRAP